ISLVIALTLTVPLGVPVPHFGNLIFQTYAAIDCFLIQLWKHSEQNIKEPAHQYLNKRHSLALNVYTSAVQSNQQDLTTERKTAQWREPFSLYSSLSEAIQILRHSQVTCHTTNYKTDTITPLNLNITNQQVRFSTFILGLNESNLTSNVTCFEVYSCFSADVTQYSTIKLKKQVLIPPYELFKVTDIRVRTHDCERSYTLRSNMNCVYDKERSIFNKTVIYSNYF
uniref:NAD(P)(+)--arginine ADP-ribosyltransferase n=1 Tax=Gouania willdenowi TaxID=441366 RepID=A0A8C5NAW3_GOUWI